MHRIKGIVTNIRKNREISLMKIQGKNGIYTVQTKNIKEYLEKKQPILITNLHKKRNLFRTTFLTGDKSLLSLSPNVPLSDVEINASAHCNIFYHIMSFTGTEFKSHAKERTFYHAIKGINDADSEIAQIALKFPLKIRRKFMYKPFVISNNFGIIAENVLFFGKLPLVFEGDSVKGILLSVISNQDEFAEINGKKSTLEKRPVSAEEKQNLLDARNKMVLPYLKKNIKQEDFKCNKEKCAASKYCKKISEHQEEFAMFSKYFSSFLEKEAKNKKILRKVFSKNVHPLRGALDMSSKAIEQKKDDFIYQLKIQHNEPMFEQREEVILAEKLPLTRKAKGEIVEKTFDDIKVKSKDELASPGRIIPLNKKIPVESGLFDFIYEDSKLKNIFLDKSKTTPQPFKENTYIENDIEQNKAVNLILNTNNLCIIKGEKGTGKKFVAKKTIENIIKDSKKVLITTSSCKKEYEQFFKDLLNASQKNGETQPLVTLKKLNDKDLYLVPPAGFDYLFLFTNRSIDEKTALSLFSKTRKVIIFTDTLTYPFLEHLSEKFAPLNTVELLTEHRFGEHILHFIQPILSSKLKSTPDKEIKIVNKETIDETFLDVVNPEKFVEFISVQGKPHGRKNKWNNAEAVFTVEAIKELVKSGVERNNIEVITAHERQKMLLIKMLEDAKIPDIYISTPNESMEKDIVFVSLVSKNIKNSQMRQREDIKIALTRSRSKLIIVGDKTVKKYSKTLATLL
ncbi:MAG: AAA domain-containing protein [Caldisericota bacterium]|nr:AAA domain-containing protein [Caldisericota bacterium]